MHWAASWIRQSMGGSNAGGERPPLLSLDAESQSACFKVLCYVDDDNGNKIRSLQMDELL